MLRQAQAEPESVPDLVALERLIAPLYKRARKTRRQRAEAERPVPLPVEASPSESLLNCYVCHARYPLSPLRSYPRLCPDCAALHHRKREQHANLTGYHALVTGGRIKIGYATALRLLRDGATVHVTTRFPNDALLRYQAEPDFANWQHRLTLLQLNLLHLPDTLRFAEGLNASLPHLDILIHNAAQSVKLPDDQLQLLEAGERHANLLPRLAVHRGPASLPVVQQLELLDQRERHGWTMQLADVDELELLEALLINAAAPALLTSRLMPLLTRSPHADRFIINVTGYDGQFGEGWKSPRHPHVNMSKAALNMMTRTSANEYAKDRIWMNSVDVGWITLEGAWSMRRELQDAGIEAPLKPEDGAARICDPIYQGLAGEPTSGKLYRHYQPATW
jgi:NAD(P)-dependent dehydrogenase (short-subunit alcohol dehydrogenase family)